MAGGASDRSSRATPPDEGRGWPAARRGVTHEARYRDGTWRRRTEGVALDAGDGADRARRVIDLTEPADGLPPVIATADDLAAAVARLAAGSGPVAVDAERASGYRYGQKAYLVQLRRAGAGTVLIDPIACPDLSGLGAALADVEAVLHAASQDLPCLAEIGYQPRELFDTELAGRLLGYPRVALGTMLEEVLGFRLAKEHSAADWSVRPLPAEMLKYAALDVEVLVELRDALAAQLDEQGKTEWARQEFAAVAAAPPAPPRADPWRRTSGIHKVRTRRALAVVRELWQTRDEIARDADLSPRRVLSDQAIVDAARAEVGKPRANRQAAARPDQRVPRAERPQVLRALDRRGGPGPAARPRRNCPRWRRGHRAWPAARAPLGGTRPGRGRAARRRPRGARRDRRGAPAARREPAPAGRAAPPGLGTADLGERRRRSPRPCSATVPAAGRPS